jgi:hypothetical protein
LHKFGSAERPVGSLAGDLHDGTLFWSKDKKLRDMILAIVKAKTMPAYLFSIKGFPLLRHRAYPP